jgi:hypothetical protein
MQYANKQNKISCNLLIFTVYRLMNNFFLQKINLTFVEQRIIFFCKIAS